MLEFHQIERKMYLSFFYSLLLLFLLPSFYPPIILDTSSWLTETKYCSLPQNQRTIVSGIIILQFSSFCYPLCYDINMQYPVTAPNIYPICHSKKQEAPLGKRLVKFFPKGASLKNHFQNSVNTVKVPEQEHPQKNMNFSSGGLPIIPYTTVVILQIPKPHEFHSPYPVQFPLPERPECWNPFPFDDAGECHGAYLFCEPATFQPGMHSSRCGSSGSTLQWLFSGIGGFYSYLVLNLRRSAL